MPDSAPGAKYDPETATLTWPLSLEPGQAITLSLAARVEAEPGQTVTNTASLGITSSDSALTASAAVYVTRADIVTPDRGGLLRSVDGQVEVHFPPGAVAKAIEATSPLKQWTWRPTSAFSTVSS